MWDGGKIYLYPAHSVESFVLCSEKAFKKMEVMVEKHNLQEIKVDWKQVKLTEEYHEWVKALEELVVFLEERWQQGKPFWRDLLCVNSEELLEMCMMRGPLRRQLTLIDWGEDIPIMGVEVGREELSVVTSAMKDWFEWTFCEEGFESLKYGSDEHHMWNHVIRD